MHQGTVCQLHYVGGGIIQFQEASGFWVRLPFLHAPPLRIGQEVLFALNSTGEAEGIEVQLPGADKESGLLRKPVQQKAQHEQTQLVPAKRHAEEAEGFRLQRPAWKLQRRIGRFQNANQEERLEMLNRAEATLRELVQQAGLDGDAICGLVCQVVGWLQAPRFSKQRTGTGGGSSEAGGMGDLQSRIRRLPISALSSLDLTDGTTKQAVETAVAYIQQLIQDVCLDDLETSRAAREWRRLQSLISTQDGPPLPIEDGRKRPQQSDFAKGGDRACLVEGDWSPNTKLRQLPSVFAGDAVQLTCPSCPRSITGRWWWRHPKTHAVSLLIPTKGCYHGGTQRSRGTVDDTSRWRPVDAWPAKNDILSNLDFCHHQRTRSTCAPCGGYSMCSHSKRRDKCRLCSRRRSQSGHVRGNAP